MNINDLLQRLQDPRLRLDQIPGLQNMRQLLELNPRDEHLQELLGQVVSLQEASLPLEDDPFAANLPPAGVLPTLTHGRVPLACLHTGVLSLPMDLLRRNMLLLGPTGGGKTNTQKALIASCLDSDATLIAFTRKSDLAESATLNSARNPVLFLDWRQLSLSPMQVPSGADELSYTNVLVDVVAETLHLIASRRLMRVTLHELLKTRPSVRWSEWIEAIASLNTRGNIRLSQYQEASVYAMKDVALHFGRVLECDSSDLLDKVTRYKGCVSICTAGLAPEMASLLASLVLHWAFETRTESDAGFPCLFLFDDALPLVHGSQSAEAEGGTSPLSTWSFMGRSRGLGILAAAQNFSLVSPALRNNCETIIICGGSVGADARELAQHLHLTKEQQLKLTQMQPGEVVVYSRSVWHLPVFGRVPLVP